MLQMTCEICGTAYEARRASSRFCSDRCRQRRRRAPGTPRSTSLPPLGLVEAARRELEAVGLQGSVLAAVALALAERIESPTETGSAVASLSREFRAVMDQLAGRAAVVDPLDELNARREAKRQAHGPRR